MTKVPESHSQNPSPVTRDPKPQSKLIVALDTASLEVAKELIEKLKGVVSFYKIGFELFTAHGWKAVELVKRSGARVFLDLKFHDIPNTVAKTASVIAAHEIDMFNVHALGGFEMMEAARKAVDDAVKGKKKKPILLAVTVLTSHSEEDLEAMGIEGNLKDEVLTLAWLAKKAGMDGVVSSPQEITLLRNEFPKDFTIVTPGIRPAYTAKGDQKRTFGPKEAFVAGADFIVVGRPITAAPDPRSEAIAIQSTLK